MEQGEPDVSEYGEVADLEYGMGLDQPPTSIIIKEEFQKRLLYQLSPKEVNFRSARTRPSNTCIVNFESFDSACFFAFLNNPAP